MISTTYERVLTRVIGEHQQTIDELRAQLAAAQARIAELTTPDQSPPPSA